MLVLPGILFPGSWPGQPSLILQDSVRKSLLYDWPPPCRPLFTPSPWLMSFLFHIQSFHEGRDHFYVVHCCIPSAWHQVGAQLMLVK